MTIPKPITGLDGAPLNQADINQVILAEEIVAKAMHSLMITQDNGVVALSYLILTVLGFKCKDKEEYQQSVDNFINNYFRKEAKRIKEVIVELNTNFEKNKEEILRNLKDTMVKVEVKDDEPKPTRH